MTATPTIVASDAGLDYLTCTFREPNSIEAMQRIVTDISGKEINRGNFRREWRMSGYSGFRVGGLECGVREDGWIVRLSGATAETHWRQVGLMSTNCSRIDCAVTVLYDRPATTILARHWRELRRRAATMQRPPKLKSWSSDSGIETIYTGSRTSDVFGRIYDKGRESGLAALLDHVRYEVEFKGDMAALILKHLQHHSDHRYGVRVQCQALFSERGCRLCLAHNDGRLIRRHARETDVSRRLRWLETAVRGTCVGLCELGYREQVMEALGLKSETVPDVDTPNRAYIN